MSKLPSSFEQLLQTIEPDTDIKNHAKNAHHPVRKALESDEEIGKIIETSFLYGSYKRGTAAGGIKDIDIAIIIKGNPYSEDHTPQKVLSRLKKALNRHYDDAHSQKDNTEYQRKSILVKDAVPDHPEIELTLDVMPAIDETGKREKLLVPDKELQTWVYSNPRAHMEYSTKMNETNGMFVPLVKMVKYWWTFCNKGKRLKPKGFWLECLVAETFDSSIGDFSELFVTTLENIKNRFYNYENFESAPELADPGMQGEILKTRMSQSQFKKFMDELVNTHKIAKQALGEEDDKISSGLWKQIFGDAFPASEKNTTTSEKNNELLYPVFDREHSKIGLMDYSHIKPLRWPMASKQYQVSIEAVKIINGQRKMLSSNSDTIMGEVALEFKAILDDNINVFDEVQWQVVNTGYDVKDDEKARRGGFDASNIGRVGRKESTLYSGMHWIECFVIHGNLVIARSGKFYISIENPKTIKQAKNYWLQFAKR